MGRTWNRTSEQTAYLHRQFASYLDAHQNGSIDAFRSQLYEGWAQLWPERMAIFPLWKEGDPPLTKDEFGTLGKAIAKRKKQLYDYIRWHSSARPVRTQNPQSLLARYVQKAQSKGRKKPSRKRTVLEVYSDLYYKLKLRSIVKDELENDPSYPSLSTSERSARQIIIYRRVRGESWATESDDVKAEIQKIYDQERQDKESSDEEEENGDEDDDRDEKAVLQSQQDCVDIIGQVITSFLQDASEATGWAFCLLGGGMNKEGEIKLATSSVGKTVSGSAFQITHNNWQDGVVKPWLDFLYLRHPIEERHARAMIWAEGPQSIPTNAVVANPTVASSPPSQTSIEPQQTATMDPTANNAAAAAALLELSTTQVVAPPQTTVTKTIMGGGLLPQGDTPMTVLLPEMVVANPGMASPPPMTPVGGLSPSSYANDPSMSDFLNPTFPPSMITHSQVQIGQVVDAMLGLSSMSVATGHLYGWQGSNLGGVPLLPQPGSFNSTTPYWGYPATSDTFTSSDNYQPNPATFTYPSALTLNTLNVSNHDSFFPMTGVHPGMLPGTLGLLIAQVSDNTTQTIPASHATVTGFASRDGTPFATAGLANGMTTPSAPSLVMDTSNGLATSSVLNVVTNVAPAEADGSKMENATGGKGAKKRKSREEEDAQLVLPDGSRRAHKPRQIDENYVLSTLTRKGRGTKRAKQS